MLSDAKFSGKWITVVTSGEAVRERPRMYFGHSRSDPSLPGVVARAVAAEPFGWSREPVAVELRVDADLVLTIADDGKYPCFGLANLPLLDRNRCLLDRRRWALAAAAALSTRTSVEVHAGGRRWCQTMTGTAPDAPPRYCGAAPDTLTRVTFQLDAGYFRPGAALPADPTELWPDGPASVRGSFTVTDLRTADTRPPGTGLPGSASLLMSHEWHIHTAITVWMCHSYGMVRGRAAPSVDP